MPQGPKVYNKRIDMAEMLAEMNPRSKAEDRVCWPGSLRCWGMPILLALVC